MRGGYRSLSLTATVRNDRLWARNRRSSPGEKWPFPTNAARSTSAGSTCNWSRQNLTSNRKVPHLGESLARPGRSICTCIGPCQVSRWVHIHPNMESRTFSKPAKISRRASSGPSRLTQPDC